MLVKEKYPVNRETTFGLGGIVAYWIEAKSEADIAEAVDFAEQQRLPFFYLGGGTNVVFGDGKINAVVIKISGLPASDELSTLIDRKVYEGLGGLESLVGIPGTVGGAVVGNAGALGKSIGDVVERVKIFDGVGMRWLGKSDCEFGYRESIFKKHSDLCVIDFELNLQKADPIKLRETADEIRGKRWNSTRKLACPGSYFKNILIKELASTVVANLDGSKIIDDKYPAGVLLDHVGARGMAVGDITVSDFHANVIVNNGNGTFRDLMILVKELKKRTLDKFGIVLHEEVRYII